MTDSLNVDQASKNLVKYLNACVQEMEMVATTLGKTAITDISKSDLCTLDPFIAKATGVQLGYVAPENQDQFFEETAPLFPAYRKEEKGRAAAPYIPDLNREENRPPIH
jgi:hypothetical protein